MGFGFWGLGFGVWELRLFFLPVWGMGSRVWGFEAMVQGLHGDLLSIAHPFVKTLSQKQASPERFATGPVRYAPVLWDYSSRIADLSGRNVDVFASVKIINQQEQESV